MARPDDSEKERRIEESSAAETRNETALTRNAVSAPNASLTRPPSPAPTASIVPHSDPFSAFATGRSPGSTTLGVAAERAGSNGAAKDARRGSST